MRNGPRLSKYVVDFLRAEGRSSGFEDRVHLDADTDSDAIEQAKWLARRTVHHSYQVRAAVGYIYVVIFESRGAMVA